ncbi:50S ribosomal protein L17 [Cerasicoccus maritimus]|uniref:50S ribosomal protein L17 n=1 Tax=Cerasicoccus maritimus TaxID=490089 RepID=UPI0028529186|nr:50S ribosomal protein L17 [Cerasicoccus maritimus]
MRHRSHRHSLGVKKEHREALMANLAAALFRHGRIETTLAKAKALRPFAEKIITLAKKAAATDDAARKLHYRRQAIAKVRDKAAVKQLFDERVSEFADRKGGYIRIYKLIQRESDGAHMGIIELIDGSDEGYSKPKRSAKKPAAKKEKAEVEAPVAAEEAPAAEEAAAEPEAAAAEGEASTEEEKKD